MFTVVDVACLKDSKGELVVKELVIVNGTSENSSVGNFHFLPPHAGSQLPLKVRKTNYWVTCNLHGISWEDGYIQYSRLKQILLDALPNNFVPSVVYVKGQEKCDFLSELLSGAYTFTDLDKLSCPKSSELPLPSPLRSCHVHRFSPKECPLVKCYQYINWMQE